MPAKSIGKIYFAFLLLLPLVFYTGITDVVLLPRQIYLSLFVAFLAVILIKDKTLGSFRISKALLICIAIYLLTILISFAQALVISESHASFSKQLLCFAFLFATLFLLQKKWLRTDDLILAVMAFGTVAIFSGLFQLVTKILDGKNLFHAIFETAGAFANKNLLSSILFLCLPFFFSGLHLGKRIRIWAIFGIFFVFLIVVVLRTRAVLIASTVFLTAVILAYLHLKFRIHIRKFILAILSFFILAIIVFKMIFEQHILNLQSSSVPARQYFYRIFSTSTFDSRILLWKNSWEMFKEHWFLGCGAGNWQIYFPKCGLEQFKSPEMISGLLTVQKPHNDFLWLLCENGVVTLIAYLGILGIAFYQTLALVRKLETVTEKWRFIYSFGALSGYVIIAFFDFPMERIEHQILLMLLFAVIFYSYSAKNNNEKTSSLKSKMLICGILFAAVYGFTISAFRLNGEWHSKKMYAAKAIKNWPLVKKEANAAENYFYRIDFFTMPFVWYEGTADFMSGNFCDSELRFEESRKLAPYNVKILNDLGTAFEKNKKHKEAELNYKRALGISPDFEDARINLAAVYYNQKKYELAFETINKIPVTSTNVNYRPFLGAILEKKVNQILKTLPPEYFKNMHEKVKNIEELIALYLNAKKNNITFTESVKLLKTTI